MSRDHQPLQPDGSPRLPGVGSQQPSYMGTLCTESYIGTL